MVGWECIPSLLVRESSFIFSISAVASLTAISLHHCLPGKGPSKFSSDCAAHLWLSLSHPQMHDAWLWKDGDDGAWRGLISHILCLDISPWAEVWGVASSKLITLMQGNFHTEPSFKFGGRGLKVNFSPHPSGSDLVVFLLSHRIHSSLCHG